MDIQSPAVKNKELGVVKKIRARFSHGVFTPLEKVEFPENEELEITIDDVGVKKDALLSLLKEVWSKTGDVSEKDTF